MIGVRIGGGLLRRHVHRRAQGGTDRGDRPATPAAAIRLPSAERGALARRRNCLGDTEVGDHRRAAREEDIVGLDVAMDDAAAMRVGERARDVLENAHRLAHRERTTRHACAHRFAIDVRHDEVRQLLRLSRTQHRHDVRMLQRGGEHDLALEPVDGDAGGEVVRQDFDDDLPAEGVVRGDKDDRHAAAAELTLDGVGSAE